MNDITHEQEPYDYLDELRQFGIVEAEMSKMSQYCEGMNYCVISYENHGQIALRIYALESSSTAGPTIDVEYRDGRFNDLVSLLLKPDGSVEGERIGNLHHKNGYVHQLTNPSTLQRNARKILQFIDDNDVYAKNP
ncbi:MAG TPA: hypothetical protein PKD20_01840 [Candidatus Saccharibacteria bacterium]|jgi:hypothetical protein|nr:hypothetical protein [Candidatus Saccharibacteria bacterium]HMT55600.1 hypothetical protein [Candidatus Saccharibacteria bacterium]